MDLVGRLEKQASLVEEYVAELSMEHSYRGVERLEQLVIQALLDLCSMALVALGVRGPRSYSQLGETLAQLGLLSREEAQMLRGMAGLRNILVHGYASIDRNRIIEFAPVLSRDAVSIARKIVGEVRKRGIDPIDIDLEKIRSVLKDRVKLAILFGGRAKGYALKGDYDIAVLLEGGCDLYALGLLQADLEEALEERVDIICLDQAPPELVVEALEGVPIIDNSSTRLELYARALSELNDLEITKRKISG